ncbi:MAG: Ig-like domain-containing protein [Burkholderiaceae bacterium]
MNMLKRIASFFLVFFLSACGGGGSDAGTSPFGGGTGGAGGTSVAADLIVTASAAQLPNTASGSVTITVTAIDASRNTVADAPVTIGADNGGVVTASATKTTSAGVVTATLSAGDDRSIRVITVTATSGSISKTTTVQVSGTTITSVLVPAVVSPSAVGEVQYLVVDSAGTAMSNQPVQVVATGLTPAQATGVTGANGEYTFAYSAPAEPGNYTVTANIAGKSDVRTVQVQPTSTVPVVTTTIMSASVSANPSVVAVNVTGSQANRSEIRALFVGANNQPIANVRVRFDLANDVNSIGGTFTTGSTTLYSDANGIVTSAYVPGSRSSPTDGVTVRACYGVSDTDPNLTNCVTSKSATLTVTSEALGVSIGTNELIIVKTLTYVKEFTVSVVDSAGVAKADVNLNVSLDLPNYRKGSMIRGTGGWEKAGVLPSGDNAVCVNEDKNRNGVLESGDDDNADGKLWPRKPDVVVSLQQSKTRSDGTAVLQIEYAKDHALWVDALITVSASGVAGSEGRDTRLVVPVPADATSIRATDTPAYVVSPYGIAGSCTDPN